MTFLLYGLCFVLLHVDMNGFDLLPDFVGYFLMCRGLGQIALKSRQLTRLQGFCLAMALPTMLLSFVTLSYSAKLVFGLTFGIARLYGLRLLVQVLQELQASFTDAFFDIDTLRVRWTLVLTAEAVTYAAMLLRMNSLVMGILHFAGMVVAVLFLMAFQRTRLAYNSVKS